MRWLALLVMVLALGSAGCSEGDEDVVISFGSASNGDFCGPLLNARMLISAAFLEVGKVSQEALEELVRNAPKEIRADVKTVAQALTRFTEEVGDDPDVLEIEAALRVAQGPEYEAAEKRIDAWEKENCTGEKPAASEETTTDEKLKTPQDRTWDNWTEAERGVYCGNLLFIRMEMSGGSAGAATPVDQGDLDQMTNNPPEPIRADVETIAQALTAYTKKVANDPTVLAAGKRLDAWAKKNCLD